MNCPQCGVEINPEQVLCVKCGCKIKEPGKKKGLSTGCIVAIVVSLVLVVLVGIIGFLAAISYPQYAKAAEKARATEAIMAVKVLADSENRYYLSSGNYTTDLSKLDIDVPESDLFVYEVDLPYVKASRKNGGNVNYVFNYNLQTDDIKCEGDQSFCQYFQ